jgi:hypothetical protein
MDNNGEERWWIAFVEFATHVLVASAIFIVLTLGAWGLHEFVHFLQGRGLPVFFLTVLGWLEYMVFIIDVLLFALQLAVTFIKTCKKLWSQIF